SSFFSSSAQDLRRRPTRDLTFVPLERSLRPRVRFFAALRAKVTSTRWSVRRLGSEPQPYQTIPRPEPTVCGLEIVSICGNRARARSEIMLHNGARSRARQPSKGEEGLG